MKKLVSKNHCHKCVWLTKDNVCPFHRCIMKHGWTVDQLQKDVKK